MAHEDKAAQAIYQVVENVVTSHAAVVRSGVWIGAESSDANLSQIRYGDQVFRYIPKLESVSPSSGDTVIMMSGPGTPLFIVGVLVGDITKALINSAQYDV